MEWKGRSSKVQRKGQEISFLKVSQIGLYLWKESKWENADKKIVKSYNRSKERICSKEGEDIFIEGEERRGT